VISVPELENPDNRKRRAIAAHTAGQVSDVVKNATPIAVIEFQFDHC